jgi:RND superfamily putative drug exporter
VSSPDTIWAMNSLSIDTAFEALARFVVRFRILVVIAWLLVAVITSVALPSLGSQVNSDNSAFLPASTPSSRATKLAGPLVGGTRRSQIVVVAVRPGGPLSTADQAAIAQETSALQRVSHVVSARETGVSADGRAAQIQLRVSVTAQDISTQKSVVSGIQATFARVSAPAGLQLHTAGSVATAVANQTSSSSTGSKLELFSMLFIIVLLGFVFRAPLAALFTLLPAGLALIIASRIIGELGSAGLKFSSFTQFLLIVLLLGAGTDYGLFLIFRVREELRGGTTPHQAVVRALSRVGESITASAATVVLALLTLLLATFGLYHDLGVPLAAGVLVMLLIGLTLLPALLAIFGNAVFWPRRPKPGQQVEGLWGRVARRAVHRPGVTLAIGVGLFLALAVGALSYSSAGFGGPATAPSGSDAAAGNAAVAQHFPQSSNNPANLILAYKRPVWQHPESVHTASDQLRSSGQFTSLAGPLNANGTTLTPAQYAQLHAVLGAPRSLPPIEPAGIAVPRAAYSAYRASAEYVSADGRAIEFEAGLTAGPQQTTQATNATPTVREVVAQAAASSGAVGNGVAGEAAAAYDISTTSNHDLVVIVPIAIAAIGLLLALVLRSAVAPLYLIVSVALSYLAALGIAVLAFVTIGGENGLLFVLPFFMFIFLLALGEDYNILVMTRIREEARHLPLKDAVVKAIGRTGSTVTSAGLILGGTFTVLALSGSGSYATETRQMGFGLAVGILMDTFLIRTLLVPSIVILLGRWNWWPSALGRSGEEDRRRRLEPAAVGESGS